MKFHTSKTEINQLILAWIGLSIAFSILFSGNNLIFTLIGSFVIVGISFLLHEMMHKVVAQHYGAWAEFRANIPMLVLAIIMAFFGFIFAAPGAVFILGRLNPKQNGITSLAGPLTNIILAIIFLAIQFLSISETITILAGFGFYINSLLAIFNLIPFGPFDGAKIFYWNKVVWTIALLISSALFIFSTTF